MLRHTDQIALIGTTASGKSALAIAVAQRYNAIVLSLDSLAVYKYTDIVSAKPTPQERGNVPHYGMDLLEPDRHFDAALFVNLYRHVHALCKRNKQPLIIVGGTSFYLKMLLEGISPKPHLTQTQRQQAKERMYRLEETYRMLYDKDPDYMVRISPHDRYRIEKALHIVLATGMSPSEYFAAHPPKPAVTDSLPIYEIVWDRHVLRERIAIRTRQMLQNGLIDEVADLEYRYGRAPQCMKAIGIKETLAYFDGRLNKRELFEAIVTHTARLAKRQRTFNRTQFHDVFRAPLTVLQEHLLPKT